MKRGISIRASVLPRIRLIRLRRGMASLNSGRNWADSVLKRAWRARPWFAISRGFPSRFVRDSTAREPIKRGEREREREREGGREKTGGRFFTADKLCDANHRARRCLILHDVRNAASASAIIRCAGCATVTRRDDKLLGIIAVMCVGALTTQFRRCFIYRGISRCINIYPPAIYTGR